MSVLPYIWLDMMLSQTAVKAASRINCCSLMLISFGVVLYQIEGGVEFNVKDCDDPDRGPSWCSKRLTDDALSAASSAYESGHSRIKVDTMDGGIVSLPSAFEAIWLTIVTMTTVGYGGVSPITPLGKITAAIIMLFGSFYLSMPLTIVGSVFYQCYKRRMPSRDL